MSLLNVNLLSAFAGIIVVCGGMTGVETAVASDVPQSNEVLKTKLDLTRDCTVKPDTRNTHRQPMRSKDGISFSPSAMPASDLTASRLRPEWVHQFSAKGPSVEFAGLGYGREGTPSLVHLAFGWIF